MTDFKISAEHAYPFTREFRAYPEQPLATVYQTAEVRRGRTIDASYDARVLAVRIHWRWDNEKQVWWGSANETIELVNPRTGKRYSSGWKANVIYQDYGSLNSPPQPGYFDELLNMTRPRTKVIVTEVPE